MPYDVAADHRRKRYDVHTPVFEGPFDLLLHLILREELDLYEVSLSTIVDGYLAELDRLRLSQVDIDLEIATEFLLIAATLIELKARRLLPAPALVDLDDELGLWEERDLLLARLLECKTFKDAARAIAAMEDRAGRSVPRRSGPEERFLALAPDLLAGVTPTHLRAAYLRATAPRPAPRVDIRHLAMVRASVSDVVAELSRALPGAGPTTFRRLTAGLRQRLDVVVRFLALLELCKEGLVDLDQAGRFGDISVIWVGSISDVVRPRLVGAAAAHGGSSS
ncbi:MAG: segregation and condensation protein A [Acidimicrobiales bacterium]